MTRFAPASRKMALFLAMALAFLALAFPTPATASEPEESEYGYIQYLSDREPTGHSVGSGSLVKDLGSDGSAISLIVDGEETTFDKGLFAHAPSTLYYTDIQEFGYQRFEAWVGITKSARDSAALVEFRVEGDGETLWSSGDMDASSPAQRVSVDISNVKVLKLVVDSRGSNAYDHSVWANAVFCKEDAAPWLYVSDKEFSYPAQVTDANILEGTFARTLSGTPGESPEPVAGVKGTLRNGKEGNDLSDAIAYTTDYTPGSVGTFHITYSVTDAQGLTRTRTVEMKIRGTEQYRTDADIDYLTTPFASFLYACRDYLDNQGKAAFDLALETLLHMTDNEDSYPTETVWGERVKKVTIDLQAAGIYMTKSDASYLNSMLMDNDPRMFHIKDWGTTVSTKGGMASTVTFYVPERYATDGYYNQRLLEVEANASRFLNNIEDGMNDAQALRAVLYPYADWIRYAGGGQLMDEALAAGQGVCGGNARGAIYLAQRMGIKSYWVRTNSHAWSNMKLNDDGLYYRVDLLARPGCFLSVDGGPDEYHGHHKEIFFNRSKGYPDMTTESFTFAHTAWPNISFETEGSIAVLAPQDAGSFDPVSLVKSVNSIYDGNIRDSVSVDDGGLASGIVDGAFKPGFYTIEYSVEDSRGNTATAKAYVQVVDGNVVSADASLSPSLEGNCTFTTVGLWNGSSEVRSSGIRQNEACSTTFAVDGLGYTHFDAWIGINETVRQNTNWGMNGKVQLEVWAQCRTESGEIEDVNLYTSSILGWYSVREHVLVAIPENAVSVTLKNVPKGAGNNHAAWGSPRFYTSDVLEEVPTPPSISGIENGATYESPVTPLVDGATEIELYRKNLPVTVDPDTGEEVTVRTAEGENDDSFAGLAEGDADLGDRVEGYQPGDEISGQGIYTLIARNTYGQETIFSFTIASKESEGDGESGGSDGEDPDNGGESGDDNESGDGGESGEDGSGSGSDGVEGGPESGSDGDDGESGSNAGGSDADGNGPSEGENTDGEKDEGDQGSPGDDDANRGDSDPETAPDNTDGAGGSNTGGDADEGAGSSQSGNGNPSDSLPQTSDSINMRGIAIITCIMLAASIILATAIRLRPDCK